MNNSKSNVFEKNHIVIVRTAGSFLNIDSYNCQEIGLAKALVKKGWNVSVILAGKKKTKRTIYSDCNQINVYYVLSRSINEALTYFTDIFPLLASLKPTHLQIHEFGMWMSYKVVKWAKKNNINVCLIQGSYETTHKPVFKQLEILFNKTFGHYILDNVNGIGCKSKMAGRYVTDYCEKNILLTPIGLDVERFSSSSQIDWKSKLELEDKHILLYVGVLENRRNPLFLLEVMKNLSDDFVLIIVGSGPLDEEVRQRINNQHELNKRCVMLGKLKQEQLPSLYRISDLFLLASDYEIYGMVLLEALYFGVPVITTLTAGSEMLIQQKKNGLIIKKDIEVWANMILEIINDKERLGEMKSFSKQNILENYLWDVVSDNYIKLYLS